MFHHWTVYLLFRKQQWLSSSILILVIEILPYVWTKETGMCQDGKKYDCKMNENVFFYKYILHYIIYAFLLFILCLQINNWCEQGSMVEMETYIHNIIIYVLFCVNIWTLNMIYKESFKFQIRFFSGTKKAKLRHSPSLSKASFGNWSYVSYAYQFVLFVTLL